MDFLKSAVSNYEQQSSAASNQDNVAQTSVAPPQESDIHEAKAVHDKVYNQNSSDVTDEDLGKAAGVEAFNAYERSESSGQSEGGQSKLIQMAMAEAMKMFSGGKGGEGGQDKSAVMQSAIAMATKLFMGKSGEGGGGVAQLMSMLQGGGKTDGSQGGSGSDMMGMLGKAAQNPQVADMLKKFM